VSVLELNFNHVRIASRNEYEIVNHNHQISNV